MYFFGILNPGSRSRGFGIGIFNFWLEVPGIFLGFSENPRYFWPIPAIWDFFESRDFDPRDPRDFHPRNPGIFTFGISRRFFIPEIGIFFRWMGYPDKKPTLILYDIRHPNFTKFRSRDLNVPLEKILH